MKWIDGPKWCSYVTEDEQGKITSIKGQVVMPTLTGGGFMAYDNTRMNKSGTTAFPLGSFPTVEAAKQAVETCFERTA